MTENLFLSYFHWGIQFVRHVTGPYFPKSQMALNLRNTLQKIYSPTLYSTSLLFDDSVRLSRSVQSRNSTDIHFSTLPPNTTLYNLQKILLPKSFQVIKKSLRNVDLIMQKKGKFEEYLCHLRHCRSVKILDHHEDENILVKF